MEVVNATGRLLAIVLLGGTLIALDITGLAKTGVLGLTVIIMVLAIRSYVMLAQATLSTFTIQASYNGLVEGRSLEVEYRICNPSLIPVVFLELSLNYPHHLKLLKGSRGGIIVIPPRGCVNYRVSFIARVGLHRIGPLRVILRDPLGLYRGVELSLGPVLEVRVKPIESERMLRALLQASRVAGLTRSRRPGEGVEFHSVRDYREGDELRRIYWRALARGRLAVKEFESETSNYILLTLILDERMLHGPYLETPLEHAARIVTVIAGYASRRGDYLALLLIGPGVLKASQFRRGRLGYEEVVKLISTIDYEKHVLRASPEVKAVVSDGLKLAKFIKSMAPRERINMIVFTSTSEDSVEVARRLSTLRSLGFSINTLILIPQLYGLKRLNPLERAVYRVKIYDEIRRAYVKIRELRRSGIQAIAITPWETPSKVIARVYTRW